MLRKYTDYIDEKLVLSVLKRTECMEKEINFYVFVKCRLKNWVCGFFIVTFEENILNDYPIFIFIFFSTLLFSKLGY